MPDTSQPRKFTQLQLLMECVQRELTYLPLAASTLLVMLAPGWDPTWMMAPALFVAGGANFIHDLLMGQGVREALDARMKRKEEAARESEINQLKDALPEGDAKAVLAVRALEKALMDKIRDNERTLELTGTFSHAYVDMVKSVANSAISALRRKRGLLETAAQLHELKADDDANSLCEQIPALDERISQARETLQEALTQLTLMESEQDSVQLSSLGGQLCERLKLAERIAHDVSTAMTESDSTQRDSTESTRQVEPEDEGSGRTRGRKKTR